MILGGMNDSGGVQLKEGEGMIQLKGGEGIKGAESAQGVKSAYLGGRVRKVFSDDLNKIPPNSRQS